MTGKFTATLALIGWLIAGSPAGIASEEETGHQGGFDESTIVLALQLRGVGELRFGERFEWVLEAAPPAEVRRGEGIRQGGVAIRSASGAVRHALPEPPGYSRAEIGPACTVIRVQRYAVIRCMRDYVFDLVSGAAPVPLDVQFSDRVAPPDWLLTMPLPWWRDSGYALRGTDLLVLNYGWVNYGSGVESTEILRGPALLELGTGRLAVGYVGDGAEARPYEAESDPREPNVIMLEDVVADRSAAGRRTITVLTRFDSCAGAHCRSDVDPSYAQQVPVTFTFD
ncbi:MAG: hypothetical protein KF911_02185 [Pseudomonadales bacterium]|nr:hypothetical protein [Pseudomonadales bacterium]